MLIQEGYFYHLSDTFFEEINDRTLMSNKENGGYRPHYFAIRDDHNPNIFWMVPVSSKFAKYKAFYDSQITKYRRCTKVVLGKFAGTDHAFLVQNAFPVIADYFDHIHTRFGTPATISEEENHDFVIMMKENTNGFQQLLEKHQNEIRLKWRYAIGRGLFGTNDKVKIFKRANLEKQKLSLYCFEEG